MILHFYLFINDNSNQRNGVMAIAVVAALGVTWLGSPAWAPVIAGIAGGLFAWMRFSEADAA